MLDDDIANGLDLHFVFNECGVTVEEDAVLAEFNISQEFLIDVSLFLNVFENVGKIDDDLICGVHWFGIQNLTEECICRKAEKYE